MPEEVKKFQGPCPSFVCRGAHRAFIPVVYVEEKWPHFDLHDRIGPGSGGRAASYPQRHTLPLAYCEFCKNVIFIGPEPQELEREINKKGATAAETPMEVPDYTATSREAERFLRAIKPVGKNEKAGPVRGREGPQRASASNGAGAT